MMGQKLTAPRKPGRTRTAWRKGPGMNTAELHAHTTRINDLTYAAWNAHDADAVVSIFAEDAVMREPNSGVEHRGRAAIRDRAVMLMRAFPDFRLEKIVLLIDGHRHADRWVMSGTHLGELFGIPATGRKVRVEGSTFTTLDEDGLVIEDVHFMDNAALAAQLGLS
jgi:steroid delta-isomerase-like uncharacterized protein